MHEFRLSPRLVERMIAKQGRAHTRDRFDGPRTALLVVDMQNYFMAPGQQFETPAARDAVPNVNRLADAVREAGGTVVWLQQVVAEWPSYAERYLPEQWEKRIRGITPGDFGYKLWPDLDVRPGDERVAKTRFSAFIQGSSDIEARLRARGVDTLLVAGVATNICCDATARDAMMLGFSTVMVSDACGTATDEEHAAALELYYLYYGDVQTTEETLSRLAPAVAGRAAAE